MDEYEFYYINAENPKIMYGPFNGRDMKYIDFGKEHDVEIYVQGGGPPYSLSSASLGKGYRRLGGAVTIDGEYFFIEEKLNGEEWSKDV